MHLRHLTRAVLLLSLTAALAVQNQPPHPLKTTSASAVPVVVAPPLPEDPNQYMREVVQSELAAQERDQSHWRFSLHREDDKGSQDRDVIETGEGSLSRTLLKFGRPLTAEERRQDEARMRKQLSDPSERARHAKREREDGEKARQMLKAIPDAFIFKYEGEEDGLVRMTFVPNPHYRPPTRELQVLLSLSGKFWADRATSRLARVEGSLFEDVSFAFGLLGRLNKGGTFKVVQKQVAPSHWEVVSMEVDMTGHAVIFKTINVKQRKRLTDFRRVPDSLTLSQAYEMLEREPNPVSANNQSRNRPQTRD